MELEDDEQDSEKKAEVTEKENVEAKEEKEEEKKPEVKVDKKEEEKKEEKVEKEEKKLTEKEIEEEKRKVFFVLYVHVCLSTHELYPFLLTYKTKSISSNNIVSVFSLKKRSCYVKLATKFRLHLIFWCTHQTLQRVASLTAVLPLYHCC